MAGKPTSRRDFLRLAAASTAAGGLALPFLKEDADARSERLRPRAARPVPPSDRVRIATIGMGIIGFIDTDTALAVPGVEFVAAADCYTGRLDRVREVYGPSVTTTRDYREILARDDVDAVLICTPDHWHAQMAIDALEAGKAVYLEKPMVHSLEEGPRVIEAQRRTGKPLQVGSQYASSLLFDKARELVREGVIGAVNMVEAATNRNSAIGAWQYSIPPDASPETIDWDRFLGKAPRHPFDPKRFFWWRGYSDYGTGVAGDLFVHLFTGIHKTLDSLGPTRVAAMGGLRFWKDGRDMPDVTLGLFDYPETDTHPSFTVALQSNFAHGGGGDSFFRFIGDEGMIAVEDNRLVVSKRPRREPSLDAIVRGYNSVRTFSEAVQQAFIEQYRAEHTTRERPEPAASYEFRVPDGYDSRYDHFVFFFESVREGRPVYEDAAFGYRAAAPSLLSNHSYWEERIYRWDPVAMKLAT
ncbi:Gfo/Idh/MocA family oxidoreductase [Rhodocaloribacter litoris]|uniref:Gfo/Idh/MocA family protein n=1 Tax=Rhodocaloribacter litoris TaxID=2558931 RepID=UPI00141FBD12|nr:Gfo/Idh/MocA family oxidoreductase [Rhodocaloribacter litoris]QXD16555.1 Gfo/Idh/MocA family oxidoreductase [Rhodocaloribacter litoris]GIV59534.1 MAG: hypothetical protein KatS3mg043_0623 [Rhodothermaceae bacterium]